MALTLTDLPHITNIKHSIEPLWAGDAGRNANSGKYTGTFIGFFDKLTVDVGITTQNQLKTIRDAIEKSIIPSVSFKDTKTGNTKTENFYGTAISVDTLNYKKGLYKPFSFSLVAISKRS